MKKLWPYTLRTRISFTKKLAYLLILLGLVTIPEQLLHTLAVLAHYLYEGIASVLEEILMHSFGLDKFYSQLIVFYLGFGIGLLALYWLWRRLPVLVERVKNDLLELYSLLRNQSIEMWQRLSTNHKINLLIIQCAAMIGVFVLLLA